jgi:hypothetical protein
VDGWGVMCLSVSVLCFELVEDLTLGVYYITIIILYIIIYYTIILLYILSLLLLFFFPSIFSPSSSVLLLSFPFYPLPSHLSISSSIYILPIFPSQYPQSFLSSNQYLSVLTYTYLYSSSSDLSKQAIYQY